MYGRAFLEKGVLFIRKREGKMKKLFYKEKIVIIVVLFLLLYNLFACSPIGADSFIEIENEKEQYKEMEQELKDLKVIKVRNLAPERFAEMQEKIYENYFRSRDDIEHQEKETYDGVHTITYRRKDMYQLLTWAEDRIHYYGMLFGEDYIYEKTKKQVMEKEIEKFFKLLGLEYNNAENGYVIDRIFYKEDNSIEVRFRRYIDGKKLSLAGGTNAELSEVDYIQIIFGNNQVIDITLRCLSERIEIKDYEEKALVDTPQKAYKLFTNFLGTTQGTERWRADIVQISYVISQAEDDVYVLRPMAEFYRSGTEKVYQVDLATKEVWDRVY